MRISSAVPAIAALSYVATAIPFHKRDIVMITKTQVVMTTVDVVKTVYGDPPSSPSTKASIVQPQAVTTSVDPSTLHPAGPKPSQSQKVSPVPAHHKAPKHKAHAPAPAPAPVPTTPTVSQAPAPAPSESSTPNPSSSSSGSTGGLAAPGTSYTGDLTYYADGLGACGITSSPSDHIVAISHVIFDSFGVANPNDNPVCGRTVNIQYNGRTSPAKVVDRCVGCEIGDLDLSYGFFGYVTGNQWNQGRISGVHWTWA